MKKIIAMLITMAMIASFLPVMNIFAEETKVDEITNVVWIGGSYGEGSSNWEKTEELPAGVTAKPFAKQVTEWISENSEETVNYYNVCIGGTGSHYGRARFEKDVLSKDPDMIFIEFTGNDSSYFLSSKQRVSIALEGMIRAVQNYENENNKEVKIAFVYRPWFSSSAGAAYNLDREVIDVYHAIADYYDIYEIDMADEAKKLWETDGVEYASMISKDNAHPTALGHYYIGKAMINILKKRPVTHQRYRSLPLNIGYSEILPVYIDASDVSYVDSENTSGFVANGTEVVSETADDFITYNFSGTSIGIVTDTISARVVLYIDGKYVAESSTGNMRMCWQTLDAGDHSLKVVNMGGGNVTIKNIIVDGIANESMSAKETYTRGLYEDACTSLDAVEGRTLETNYVNLRTSSELGLGSDVWSRDVIGINSETLNNKFVTYQLYGTTDFGENSNITNVEIEYLENGKSYQKTARKDFVVRAIDKDNNVLKIFDAEDCNYELNSSYTGSWQRYTLKVYNVPTDATGIEVYAYNNHNTCLANVKIAYSDIEVDGIFLDIPEFVEIDTEEEATVSFFTNNGQTKMLDADAQVSYTSSNVAVATVDENGIISAKTTGNTLITAIVTNGEEVFTDTKNVIVGMNYYDTEPKEIPENLILSTGYYSQIVFGSSNAYVNYLASGSDLNMEVTQTGADKWWVFGGMRIPLNGKMANIGGAKAGKTYVFQSMVKRLSGEETVPYYGVALDNLKYSYVTTPATDTYGKNGMAVTSTDWMPFRDTLTIPENYTVAEASQALHTGLRVQNTADLGASVAIKKTLVNASVEGSMDTDGFYLAEEAPHDIKITVTETDSTVLNKNGTLTFKAEVLNQLGLQGTLNQDVEWAVVSEDRTEVIEDLTLTTSGNTATVYHDGKAEAREYAIVAVSNEYEIVKGIEFTVTDTMDYHDTEPKAIPENLFKSAAYWNAANDGNSTYVKYDTSGSDINIEVIGTGTNRWWVFGGMSIKAKGSVLDFGGFKAGKTYVFQSMVKRLSGEDAIPYYGFALNNGNYNYVTTPATDTYGKDGMAVTSTDWMLFRDTLTVPENYTVAETSQTLHTGLRVQNTADLGASVAIKKTLVNTSVEGSMDTDGFYLAEEVPHDIKVTVAETDSAVLNKNDSLTFEAEVLNQLGLQGTLNQDVEWKVVTVDRKSVIDNIDIQVSGNIATLSCGDKMSNGKYAVVAVSEQYEMVKGIEFTVTASVVDDIISDATEMKLLAAEKKIDGSYSVAFGLDIKSLYTAASQLIMVIDDKAYATDMFGDDSIIDWDFGLTSTENEQGEEEIMFAIWIDGVGEDYVTTDESGNITPDFKLYYK